LRRPATLHLVGYARESACWTIFGGEAISQVVLGPGDRGSSVEARVGDAIVVELPENPTTGYRWAFHRIDSGVLVLEASNFKSPPGVAMGASGQRSLLLRVTGEGRAEVELKLWRDWEGEESAVDRYPFTVIASS
jgi:inhibitor of cysteine peptidase